MRKSKVLDVGLQDQVYDKLSKLQPRRSIYDPDFIAANQVRVHIESTLFQEKISKLKSHLNKIIFKWDSTAIACKKYNLRHTL